MHPQEGHDNDKMARHHDVSDIIENGGQHGHTPGVGIAEGQTHGECVLGGYQAKGRTVGFRGEPPNRHHHGENHQQEFLDEQNCTAGSDGPVAPNGEEVPRDHELGEQHPAVRKTMKVSP